MLSKYDLLIQNEAGDSFGYVFDPSKPMGVAHGMKEPNPPLNIGKATPGDQSWLQDVRSSDGDKALTIVDWSEGAGQKLYDTEKSSASRFDESSYIDINTQGEIELLRDTRGTTMNTIGGPIFAALGKLWCGTMNGGLKYSTDGGDNWSDATITSGPNGATISGFTTDGKTLYFCCGGGSVTGIWANTSGDYTFTKYGSSPTTSPIQKIAYQGGILYAATGAAAGTIDSTTGAFTDQTPDFLNDANVTIDLVTVLNAVYWVVTKNANSMVYKLYWEPSAATMMTENYQRFPEGFIATCANGYLGNLDVGGYWDSLLVGVGKGSVYRINDGYMALLFDLGDIPEETENPTASDPSRTDGAALHDNRIIACCAGTKDTYWLTNRHCWRWDLDSGGVSHVFDYFGAGLDVKVTNEYGADDLPTGGTISESGIYRTHTFNAGDNFVVPTHFDKYGSPITTVPVDYLLVGGGGSGGDDCGGGGGGGALTSGSTTLSGTNVITIGAGAGPSDAAGGTTKITKSSVDLLTAAGGGSGGNGGAAGSNGACGGGGGGDTATVRGGGTGSYGGAGGSSAHFADDDTHSKKPAGGGGGAYSPSTNGGTATEVEV